MQPKDDFSKGIQTIERAIIEGVRPVGRHLTTADFTWHRGHAVVPGPDMTDLQVRIGRRAAVGDRPETLLKIQRIIAEASQLPR